MESCPRCKASAFPEDNFCGTCGYKFNQNMKIPLVTKQDIKVEDVRANLGSVYFKLGKYNLAKEVFKNILTDNPTNENAINMLNQINELQQKSRTADKIED